MRHFFERTLEKTSRWFLQHASPAAGQPRCSQGPNRLRRSRPVALAVLLLLALTAASSGISLVLLPAVPALATSSQPATGYWALSGTTDNKTSDYYDEEQNGNFLYQYARSNFGITSHIENTFTDDDGQEQTAKVDLSLSATFSVLPERITPGQNLSISVAMGSSVSVNMATEDSFDMSGEESTFIAWISLPGNAETTDGSKMMQYGIPVSSRAAASRQEQVTFRIPAGYSDTDTFEYSVGLTNSPYVATQSTTYVYQWMMKAEEKAAHAIELRGLVRSLENKPMPWMQLQALVYEDQTTFDGSKQPADIISGVTDHEGRYQLNIPAREKAETVVGILLVGTMKCQHPFDNNRDIFNLVDVSDTFSRDNQMVAVATWLVVDPADYTGQNPTFGDNLADDQPIPVYRLLAFYNLGLGAWSFDAELMPDPVYFYSSDADPGPRLEGYSTIYTAAYDAWFFGANILQEEQSLLDHPVRIELRWVPTAQTTVSHYSPADNAIRLTAPDCLRDDNSRFTILHEFGHYFDYTSNGSTNFRAASGMGPHDTNHGGYMNASTSDSYLEGFATSFGGLVQRFSGYPNPARLDWIDLSAPSGYRAWGDNGKSEELAIAALLYHSLDLVGDVNTYWGILKPDRSNFYGYYQALETALAASAQTKADTLKDFALTTGLYTMPFGNGQYDPGEPFLDQPDASNQLNNTFDAGESYADLMFATDSNGLIDPSQPLRAYQKERLVVGAASDALRNRQTVRKAPNSYIGLNGEPVDYVLVTISTESGGTTALRAVDKGRVFVALPDQLQNGRVELAIPGGNVIYEGDLTGLQQRCLATSGQAANLDEATVSAADLPPAGISLVLGATYGTPGATGLLERPILDANELASLSAGYNPLANYATVVADLINRSPDGSQLTNGQGPDNNGSQATETSSGWNNNDNQDNGSSSGGPKVVIIVILVLLGGFTAFAVIVLTVVLARRKPGHLSAARPPVAQPANQPPVAPPNTANPQRFCIHCGDPVTTGERFCDHCGQLLDHPPETTPAVSATPPKPRFCTACGQAVTRDDLFCNHCGKRL